MNKTNLKKHWEQVYDKQEDHERASWYQETPQLVFDWINHFTGNPAAVSIIDIGGGDSYFADLALEKGYTGLSVLDISRKALKKASERLQEKAADIQWICEDVTSFTPHTVYDIWHDRAAFHFLSSERQKKAYKNAVVKGVAPGGWVILATFSKNGPEKCSGLEVTRYSEKELRAFLEPEFEWVSTKYHDHITPAGITQNFIYTLFKRVSS